MFYKYDEINKEWFYGSKIYLPNGKVLSNENKLKLDGWLWLSEPPQEYIVWKKEQDNNLKKTVKWQEQ